MDIRKLCGLANSEVSTVRVEDTSAENSKTRSFMRVSDRVEFIPKTSEDRKVWLNRKLRTVLAQAGIPQEDYQFIKDSIQGLFDGYESRYQKVVDSLSKERIEHKSLKETYEKSKDLLKKYKALGSVEQISDSISKAEETANSLKSEIDSLKSKIQDSDKSAQVFVLKNRLNAARLQNEELKKKLKDSEVVIQSKEDSDKLNEELQKKLDENQKQLEENQKLLQQKQQELEELKKQQEQSKQTIQLQDSKNVTHIIIRKTKDSVQIKDVYDIPYDLLSKFASLFEDWLQTGSAYVEQRLKDVTETIGNDTLKTLVQKATDYEPLDSTSYEELTSELKETLEQAGLRIPSLALISDSALSDQLKERFDRVSQIPATDLLVAVQDFAIDPNDMNRAKLEGLSQKVQDAKIKEGLKQILMMTCCDGWTDPIVADCLKDLYKILDAQGKQLDVKDRYYKQVPLTVTDTQVQLEEKPIEVQLTPNEYRYISDSVGRFKKLAKYVKDCDSCCPTPVEGYQYPLIQNVALVERSPYITATYGGLGHLFMVPEGVDRGEIIAKIQSSYNDEERWKMLCQLIPIEPIMEVAQSLGQYDIVTDSLLYKRHMSDSYYITETMKPSEMIGNLPKFKKLIDSYELYNKISKEIDNPNHKLVRLAVSDSHEFESSESFKTITPKGMIDYKGKTNIRLYFA